MCSSVCVRVHALQYTICSSNPIFRQFAASPAIDPGKSSDEMLPGLVDVQFTMENYGNTPNFDGKTWENSLFLWPVSMANC